MKTKLLTILCALLFSSIITFAQEHDSSLVRDVKPAEDTTFSDDENWGDWEKDFDKEWDKDWKDWGSHSFKFKGMPSVSLNYGLAKLSRKDLTGSFSKPGMIELRLGYQTEKSIKNHEEIIDQSNKYFHLGNINSDIGTISNTKYNSNTWRFGLGNSSGYGYKLGNSAILLNHTVSIDWSRIDIKSSISSPGDSSILSLYNKSFRFGTTWNGGIQVKIIPQLAIDASFERSIIFERHMFWKWAGSLIVESAGQMLIDHFIGEILDSSPNAAPVVNFLLKNALSYGIYELRKEKMNWPFETASPLAYDQFKFGLTFIF